MKIGIVGGGINGLSCAWLLSQAGHDVELFESGRIMRQTSSASSKLLHGGLRYLEHGEIRLVREALRERDAWIERVPELTRPLRIVLPLYRQTSRPRWKIRAGLFLYDWVAGRSRLPGTKWRGAQELSARDPGLKTEGLIGGYEFSDGQMDDYRLGCWVADQARAHGVVIKENSPVDSVSLEGCVRLANGDSRHFDRVINVAGPWAGRLLERSHISTAYQLDGVRGSHLVLDRPCPQAYLLEAPSEERIFFVLPWKGRTLLGTTEVRQDVDQPIICSEEEKHYLLAAYNHYCVDPVSEEDIKETFAGVRPLLYTADDPGKATREYAIERKERLINVFGGKWTTTLALAKTVVKRIDK